MTFHGVIKKFLEYIAIDTLKSLHKFSLMPHVKVVFFIAELNSGHSFHSRYLFQNEND